MGSWASLVPRPTVTTCSRALLLLAMLATAATNRCIKHDFCGLTAFSYAAAGSPDWTVLRLRLSSTVGPDLFVCGLLHRLHFF